MQLPLTLPPSAHSGSVGDVAKCHRDGAYSTVPIRPKGVGKDARHHILPIPGEGREAGSPAMSTRALPGCRVWGESQEAPSAGAGAGVGAV